MPSLFDTLSFTRHGRRRHRLVVACAIAAQAWLGPGQAMAQNFGPWGAPVSVDPGRQTVNSPVNDGCPIEAPDGLTLFFASNRPAPDKLGTIDQDIWVAYRESEDAPWSEVQRLPFPVNTAADEFCPTPLPGNRLLFVSRKRLPDGTDNKGDIYLTRQHPVRGWLTPVNLGSLVNSAVDEFSPSLVEADGVTMLYFSSSRVDMVNQKIFVSVLGPDDQWEAPTPVSELNLGIAAARPNLRKDGLEIVFDVTYPNLAPQIYTASRSSVFEAWQDVHPIDAVNIAGAAQTRPTLSRDGSRLYFGSTRANVPGNSGADVFVSTRSGPGEK